MKDPLQDSYNKSMDEVFDKYDKAMKKSIDEYADNVQKSFNKACDKFILGSLIIGMVCGLCVWLIS